MYVPAGQVTHDPGVSVHEDPSQKQQLAHQGYSPVLPSTWLPAQNASPDAWPFEDIAPEHPRGKVAPFIDLGRVKHWASGAARLSPAPPTLVHPALKEPDHPASHTHAEGMRLPVLPLVLVCAGHAAQAKLPTERLYVSTGQGAHREPLLKRPASHTHAVAEVLPSASRVLLKVGQAWHSADSAPAAFLKVLIEHCCTFEPDP